MKTYLLKVRKYSIITNNYELYVYKVTTDNIYRIIGKMMATSLEHIKRVDYSEWMQEREDYWKENGFEIRNYNERRLSEDLYPLNYITELEETIRKQTAQEILGDIKGLLDFYKNTQTNQTLYEQLAEKYGVTTNNE